MGQNSSTLINSGSAVSPRNKPKPPRPSEPPKIPKIPNYVVAENKVIPNGVGDMESARKLLRPVSQELTRYHPEFADIFQCDPETEFLAGRGGGVGEDSSLEMSLNGHAQSANKENYASGLSDASSQLSGVSNRVNYTPDPYSQSNGFVPNGKPPSHLSTSGSADDLLENTGKDSNLKRTHSLERDNSNKPRVVVHKRQASLTNGILPHQKPPPAIPEDPREHLYNVARHVPFSNLIPANASLPLKNSFHSDYSLNLTYAQLAEYRRQQRNMDLESKTEQKLKDQSIELSAANITPKSPFDHMNLGAKSKSSVYSMHSISTGSSDNGVSKSKKKKAAPPPPPPPSQKEPPVDYDMHDGAINSNNNKTSSLQRRNSSASGNIKSPPPEPHPKPHRMSIPNLSSRVERNNNLAKSAEANLNQQPQQVPPPPPPPPPPMPSTTLSANNNVKAIETSKVPGYMSLDKSVSDAKAQLEMLKQMLNAPKQESVHNEETKNNASNENAAENNAALNQNETVSNGKDNSSNNFDGDSVSAEKENYNIPLTNQNPSADDKSSSSVQVNKMSSLLQHDIILAAQGQAAKQKKMRQPPALEKPKDPAEIFREELKKAAEAREERRKDVTDPSFDKDDTLVSSTSDDDSVVLRSNQRKRQQLPSETNKDQNTGPNPNINILSRMLNHVNNINNERSLSQAAEEQRSSPTNQNAVGSLRSSASFEEMSISSNNSQRVYSSTWTPEDDLDPDDDILQERNEHDRQPADLQGFKSSIVPMKVKDLKDRKEKKTKKNKYEKQAEKIKEDAKTEDNNKNKFGSIRRFKKSVHENVKNAFGSISKASGKNSKKHKSQDILNSSYSNAKPVITSASVVNLDTSDNWELLGDGETSIRRSRSEDYLQHPQTIDESSDDSDHSDAEVGDIDFASGINERETDYDDDHDHEHEPQNMPSGKEGSPIRQMKRAGVAYVSGTGQIIVLPEYNTVKVDAEGKEIGKSKDDESSRAPKLFRKKDKKLKYESTVRMTERHRREEAIAREISEKEHRIERERLRQQDIERDFRRLRDLDTQERLQRMQTDSILQQLTFLQQQQVRQAHHELNNGGGSFNQPTPGPNLGPLINPSIPNQANSLITISNVPQHQTYTQFQGPSLPNLSNQTHFTTTTNPNNSSTTALPNGYLNNHLQTSSQPSKPSSAAVNTSHYTTHSSPIIGNNNSTSPNANLNIPNMPNLSAQDLNHLSGYMKMMGVAPPTTQQQWAFLLSSVSINPTNFPGSHMGNTTANTTNGPDLSQLFGVGKTLESTVVDFNSKPTFYELIHKNNTNNNNKTISNIQTNLLLSGIQTNLQETNTNRLVELESDNNSTHSSENQQKSSSENGSITTSMSSDTAIINSTPEERIDSLTSSQSYKIPTTNDNKTNNENTSTNSRPLPNQNSSPDSMAQSVSPRLPSQVYGPIGFKPVSFPAAAGAT